jgi:DNA-binding response OmpR family regulator
MTTPAKSLMRILIVDDDPELCGLLKQSLTRRRYRVDIATDGPTALDRLFDQRYDLVLLDIMLPELDGLSVLREIRSAGVKTPVLMLTAKGDVRDRIRGLDDGADDYLAKPFALAELMARTRSLLRRAGGQATTELAARGLTLNTINREVRFGSQPLRLTPKEFSLLEFLMVNQNRVISRVSLAEHVWGDAHDPFTMSNFIDVHIKNLRRKCRAVGAPNIIQTVRGVGFVVKDGPD